MNLLLVALVPFVGISIMLVVAVITVPPAVRTAVVNGPVASLDADN